MEKMKKRKAIGAFVKGAAYSLTALLAFSCGNSQQGGMPALSLAVMTVEPTSQELNSAYPATIKGQQDIEIRARVSGYITKLCVDEGAVVHKGQPLFLIDAVPYQKAVQAAEAAVEVAKANVATTQLTVDSKTELHAQNIISDYDLQTAKNSLASAKAALAQAEAQLASAHNDLSYTTITSPSDGVVGTIPFRVGSLVGTTTQEPLTVVSDINKMFVYFSMNEKQLLALTRQKDGSVNSMIGAMPEVQLQLADGTMYPAKGKIETLSGVIDLSTGAVQMRATFPNAQRLLRSGGTGTVLIPSVLDSALLIPQSATYEVQDKKFVYVLGDSSKVKNTEITVFPLDNGKQYVVTSGLKPGEQVVVEGVATLRDGMPIQPITPEQSAAKVQAMTQQMQQAAAAQK
ncbi:efflux RND transporter periplasmic adaptor subunit [Alistipes indistinctus]|uniref:efflux RND transporter periplasmic adaptor subunit n=1 Tax=Alistipes indistinctus TaxID=626932 RepID=UPI000E517E0E|nr:efflux RND transporter periplasmic adaptor subunit [Alistipes indistinctus]